MPAIDDITKYLEAFALDKETQLSLFENGDQKTRVEKLDLGEITTTRFINEFWTSRQRQTASIQEISYRACFKPQLPRFFIELLTVPGDTVYDPFGGRGTTILEAALLGRRVLSNDINPLSKILTAPRLQPPPVEEVEKRLGEIPFRKSRGHSLDLSMFYHPRTEAELLSLRAYLHDRKTAGTEDGLDRWIRMVATNRLSGHSKGFFSVYTMPPNQAVSAERQKKINLKRNQQPEYRDVKKLIIKKSIRLMRNLTSEQLYCLRKAEEGAVFLEKDASKTKEIAGASISLTVTSPPFLNIVQYTADNWLRCWFNHIDVKEIDKKITMASTVKKWAAAMGGVFGELSRISTPGGWIAFEVGEIRGGKINLEETVVPLGLKAGLQCAGVVVNRQNFTKTSNIWGISNNRTGTNSNRIVLFKKPG